MKKPEISFLFYFHNAADYAEAMLVPFLELTTLRAELAIINDGSTDSTDETISSVLDHYENENTFYFINDRKKGAGQSLNEVLSQINAPCFAIIDKVCVVNEARISTSVLAMHDSGNPVNLFGNNAHITRQSVLESLDVLKAPASFNFLFNLDYIPSGKCFINPFISSAHAADLYLRIQQSDSLDHAQTSLLPSDDQLEIQVSQKDCKVILFHSDEALPNEVKIELPAKKPEAISVKDIEKLWERVCYLRQEGHYAEALDLSNEIMKEDPNHIEAEDTKIFLLERLNRYVEASELKFLRKRKKNHIPATDASKKEDILVARPVNTEPEPEPEQTFGSISEEIVHQEKENFRTSIVIPVTGLGLPFIEPCLISVYEHCNPENTELIVVDNACLDDTYSYLNQLRNQNFFNIKIIKNLRNAGYARSVNQGVEKARGELICVMHADIILESDAPGLLSDILEQQPSVGLLGTLTDHTMNPEQAKTPGDNPLSFIPALYIDSFCMAFRKYDFTPFDTNYKQAWFEDVDFCWQFKQRNQETFIADGIQVRHYLGAFTESMGIGFDSVLYQDNLSHFNSKWETPAPNINADDNTDEIEELIMWGHAVNIYHPHENVINRAAETLTSETKTSILNTDFDQHELTGLVRLLMAVEQRDLLRQLEEKLIAPIDSALRCELIHFYYTKNVYSRCLKYLDLNKGEASLTDKLYKLRIAWSEKKLDEVGEMLTSLMEEAPGHPEVYKIAGDYHSLENRKEEAEEFYTLADQLDPFRFPWPEPVKSESGGFKQAKQPS